jgi:plastocyanin
VNRFRIGALLATVAGALAFAGLPAAADTPPHDAVVIVYDTGFQPAAIAIQQGGSVTWKNRGKMVHTAATIGGPPMHFDTGGFGPNQDRSLTFAVPGTYNYTSETDCLNGNKIPMFVCGGYSVIVVPPDQPAPLLSPTVLAGPTPTATLPPTFGVSITDTGASPPSITVLVNQSVTFTNAGTVVHTATSLRGAPLPFDSGGLGPGQSTRVSFALPGTYPYTSQTDCHNPSNPPGFNCGATYTVVVQGSSG